MFMKLKLRTGQRKMLAFALIGGSESTSGCQNVSLGTMPGIERYLYLAHYGAVMGPWACWIVRK